jgi:hypothetical protein
VLCLYIQASNLHILKLTVLGITLMLSLSLVSCQNPGVAIKDETGFPVWVKCQSKDTQIDPRTLQNGDIMRWSFRPSISMSTLYYCLFWWNNLSAEFSVWDINNAPLYNASINSWSIRQDGFYMYDPVKQVWNKMHSWAPGSCKSTFRSGRTALKSNFLVRF